MLISLNPTMPQATVSSRMQVESSWTVLTRELMRTCQWLLKLHISKCRKDQLLVAELRNYNKRWTHYFVKFILISMRIIYCLSRACCYCSGSPRRMTRTQKKKITEKDHTRTRPVLQNSPKDLVITFDSQKLWWSMRTFLESLSSLLSNGVLDE